MSKFQTIGKLGAGNHYPLLSLLLIIVISVNILDWYFCSAPSILDTLSKELSITPSDLDFCKISHWTVEMNFLINYGIYSQKIFLYHGKVHFAFILGQVASWKTISSDHFLFFLLPLNLNLKTVMSVQHLPPKNLNWFSLLSTLNLGYYFKGAFLLSFLWKWY